VNEIIRFVSWWFRAGIIGDTTPVVVGSRDGEPVLDSSCASNSNSEADPAIRLQAFLDGFPQRSTSASICNGDISDALTEIADLLAAVISQ